MNVNSFRFFFLSSDIFIIFEKISGAVLQVLSYRNRLKHAEPTRKQRRRGRTGAVLKRAGDRNGRLQT